MSRIRSIKPDFFIDDKVGELTVIARLLFVGLWCLADKAGRLEDNPKKIKVQILPYDEVDCDALLGEIADKEMIVRYEVDGKRFIEINNFLKHQRPHHTEKDSDLPEFNGSITVKQPCQDGEVPDGRERKGKERKGRELNKPFVESNSTDESLKPKILELFSYWQSELNHPQSRLDKKRRAAIKARLDEGYTSERIKQAIRGIKNCPHNMGQNDRATIYDDIELICRSGKNVDRFADAETAKPRFTGQERYENALLTGGAG